ncbi:MFS transporter [Niveibacterium sp. SC-1]|uniref:MFS transporter n=1 Tax=Niveibacterium sp. SC-1 TaxID=3135646 RepID=UPI00311E2F88
MTQAPALPDALRAQRPFVYFWFARVFTAAGYQMQSVAIAWQIYELTHSAFDLGLVGLMQFIPRLLLMPVAGHVADHYERRRVVFGSQAAQAIGLVVLLLASAGGQVSRELIFLLALITGAARSFEMPATQALLPSLVPPSLLSRAIAAGASAMQAATILAPALGGVLYALGATTVYAITTALFVAAASLTLRIRPLTVNTRKADMSPLTAFLEGLRFIHARRAILGAISLDLFAVLLGGATALLPVIAHEVLDSGPLGLGLLRSAPAAGALAMSLWLAHHPLRQGVGRLMFGAVAVFGLATVVFGFSNHIALSLVALTVLGAADMVSVVIRGSFVQLHTPDEMRGRVSAVNSIFIGASNQLGEFESGITAAWLGVVPAVVLGGIGTVLVAALWMRMFPELAKANSLHPEEKPA